MNMPGFTAEESLRRAATSFGHSGIAARSADGSIIPAIPYCGNCPDILDRCAETGGRPRAVCRACAIGDCYSGVENPIPPYPWGWGRSPPGGW
jgi:hypothetical protein